MAKKVSFGKAAKFGAKDTLATALIAFGAKFLSEGNYLVGGGFVAVGWVLLVVDYLVG